MNKKLFITLSIMVISARAMELTELTMDQQALPTDAIEEKVVIIIEDQEKAVPARYIPLIKTLKNLRADLPEPSSIPLPRVSLAAWQLIEPQLERVYRSSQGDKTSDEILADYRQLDSPRLIDLSWAVDYLDISLLKEITLAIAQAKLTTDEILGLPADMRNEVIKRKVFKIACPVALKERVIFRGHKFEARSVCVTSDNKIVSGSGDCTVRIWDVDGKQLAECRGHEDYVQSVCVTSDNRIVSGSSDESVRIWDMQGTELAVCARPLDDYVLDEEEEIFYPEDYVYSVCVTSDNRIVSGCEDETVRVWDMNGKKLAECRGHEDCVYSVCVTSDNKIVSGSYDKTVRIWDMSGKELAVFRGHEECVNSVCVTSDNRIVSGSGDCTVRIWDMDGEELAICRGHEESVYSVCVTQDNKIISGSSDKTVRIWDMDGNQLAVCQGHEDEVNSVCVTSDNRIVSGSADGILRIWDMSDVILNNRLSSMSEKQAKLAGKVLEQTESLRANEIFRDIDNRDVKDQQEEILRRITILCCQRINVILEDKELEEVTVEQSKKRKEGENGESNPAKKVRLSQELIAENKE